MDNPINDIKRDVVCDCDNFRYYLDYLYGNSSNEEIRQCVVTIWEKFKEIFDSYVKEIKDN